MTNTINSSALPLDAVTCLLMAKVVSRMPNYSMSSMREVFWETLPDRIPDLETHLPALIFAIGNETNDDVMDRLSSHPLPTILSREAVSWRSGLVAAWEKRLKKACDGFNETGRWDWMRKGMVSLRGLTQVDKCGLPPGKTCPSVLPILLKEARSVHAGFMCPGTPFRMVYHQLGYLAALSGWRPAPNVITDPAVLNEWADFWLELYQQDDRCVGEKEPNDFIILKGIAAKALLNLIETNGKETPELPAGMESLLLESLMRAAEVGGTERPAPYGSDTYHLSWLSWQPRDVTRFPLDTLAELPKNLLKRFRLSCQSICQNTYRRWSEWSKEEMEKFANPLLIELIKWDRAGVLAACDINLLPSVATELSDYLNIFHGGQALGNEYLLNQEVCWWLIRHEVANIKEGRELLQKLESHLKIKCKSGWQDRCFLHVAWYGRMQLQCVGLATETAASFHENLLEGIKLEGIKMQKRGSVLIVLSLWRPEKNVPEKACKELESLWKKKLKLRKREIADSAALFFLGHDPADDIVTRRQKLWDAVRVLPKERCPKLNIAEMMYLMGELPSGTPNADPNAVPDRMWQFRADEMRFRFPTEPAVPASTPTNVPTVSTDRTLQMMPGSQAQPGRCYG